MAAIRDVMSSSVTTVPPTATVAEAATVMGEKRIGSLIVLDDDRLAGIFTERDIVRALANDFDAARQPLEQWMTREPTTIGPDATVGEGLDLMLTGNFRHLPVVDGERVVGVVSIRDLSAAKTEA